MNNQIIKTSEKPILADLMRSPTQFYKNLSPTLTVQEAIASNTPPIGLLSNIIQDGSDVMIAILTDAITDLNAFFNFSDTGYMTPAQVHETSKMILKGYNALKIEDVRVCFGNGKKGHYGQLYNRIDGQIIMTWLQNYSTERTNEFLRIKDHNEKQALNKKIDPAEINPEGQRKVIELLKSAIKPVDEKKVEKPVREKSSYEKLIQRFYRQFFQLWSEKRWRYVGFNSDAAGKWIKRYGMILNESEYVELKIKQHERIMNKLLKRNVHKENKKGDPA